MGPVQVVLVILVFMLIAVALHVTYKYGYEKGIHDLTQEIDEGIRLIKKEKENQ